MRNFINALCFLLAITLLQSCTTNKIVRFSEGTLMKENLWSLIPMTESSFCSDSSSYFIFSRKAPTSNLIIHFSGGGACWDEETCTEPLSLWSAIKMGLITHRLENYYIPSLSERIPWILGGIFSSEVENPFYDWNVVFIPYCSADLHLGNSSTSVWDKKGNAQTVHFNGQENVKQALDWVYQHFPNPEKVLVSGESAGGFGAMFYSKTIAQHYTQSKLYQLTDCAYIDADRWTDLAALWKINLAAEQLARANLVEASYFLPASQEITYLQINSLYDETLTQFEAKLDNVPTNSQDYINDWATNLKTSIQFLAQSDLDFRYFVTDYKHNTKRHQTPHTFLNSKKGFFGCEEDGVILKDWLHKNIILDESSSVGANLLVPN